MKHTAHPDLAIAFLLELVSPQTGAMALANVSIRPLVDAPAAQRIWRERVGEGYAETYEIGLASYAVREPLPTPRLIVAGELWEALESGLPPELLLADVESSLNERK